MFTFRRLNGQFSISADLFTDNYKLFANIRAEYVQCLLEQAEEGTTHNF